MVAESLNEHALYRKLTVLAAHSENRRGSPQMSYAVGAAGAALLLGSGAVYLWNDGRHDSRSTENAALERDRDALLAAFRIPSQDLELDLPEAELEVRSLSARAAKVGRADRTNGGERHGSRPVRTGAATAR